MDPASTISALSPRLTHLIPPGTALHLVFRQRKLRDDEGPHRLTQRLHNSKNQFKKLAKDGCNALILKCCSLKVKSPRKSWVMNFTTMELKRRYHGQNLDTSKGRFNCTTGIVVPPPSPFSWLPQHTHTTHTHRHHTMTCVALCVSTWWRERGSRLQHLSLAGGRRRRWARRLVAFHGNFNEGHAQISYNHRVVKQHAIAAITLGRMDGRLEIGI